MLRFQVCVRALRRTTVTFSFSRGVRTTAESIVVMLCDAGEVLCDADSVLCDAVIVLCDAAWCCVHTAVVTAEARKYGKWS